MIEVLDYPLVSRYLRDLDIALAGLPQPAAAELVEQIRTHLLEALPRNPDQDAVIAVLAALGPARLVAEAAARPGPGSARPRGPMRRALAWYLRVPVAGRLAAPALVAAIALLAGLLIYWHAQPGLQCGCDFVWWYRVDCAHDVQTEAAGVTQDTVPIRLGQLQGFAILVYNPSGMTQFIRGNADPISISAPVPPSIAVATTGNWRVIGEPRWVSYRPVGSIPPRSYRWIRVMWRSAHCYLNAAGGGQGTTSVHLNVRVGWITRTEQINLGTQATVAATTASTRTDRAYCRNHPPGSP